MKSGSRNSPLQTFFFVPSFIAFVRHSSLSLTPQLQHPSADIVVVGVFFCAGLLVEEEAVGPDGVGVGAPSLSGEPPFPLPLPLLVLPPFASPLPTLTSCPKLSAVGGTALSNLSNTGFCARCFAMLGDIFSSVRNSAASFSLDGVDGGGDLR